jgi:hypothetical protein
VVQGMCLSATKRHLRGQERKVVEAVGYFYMNISILNSWRPVNPLEER